MPEDRGVDVEVEGMPGPRGGGRSFRVAGVAGVSSSSDPGTLADNFDLLRGLGGNAKFACFAVCRSSPLFSAASALLCAARSRDGEGDADDDGGLGVLLRPGICNVGGRNRSASDEAESSSNRPRSEEGSLARARGRTVDGEDNSSAEVSRNDSLIKGASTKDRPRTVSNSQGLSSLTPKSCILEEHQGLVLWCPRTDTRTHFLPLFPMLKVPRGLHECRRLASTRRAEESSHAKSTPFLWILP
jgi:hypothetical protein